MVDLDRARSVLAEADEVVAVLRGLDGAPERGLEAVRAAWVDSREERVLAQLDGVDVGALRDVTRERLRIGVLTDAGVTSVGRVVRLGRAGLERLSGIGPQTATHLLAAAEQVATVMRESVRFRIDVVPTDPVATRLLQALHLLGEAKETRRRYAEPLARALAEADGARPLAQPLTGALRRLLLWGERRRRAEEAVATLGKIVEESRRDGLVEDGRRVLGLLEDPMHPLEVWEDFRAHAARYYALLDEVAPTRRERDAAQGRLPAELVDRVQRQPLTTALLTVSLRGYQEFGARFALAQRKVVLGDEMGLGKTVQAIAVIADRFAAGARHALVVCPASVCATWERELRAHAQLDVHRLISPWNGEDPERWSARGGVAVVSIDSLSGWLRRVTVPDVLVVDEAHYAKNPTAYRARAVARLAAETDYVVFLTGTVMENRLAEFRTLVSYLQPDLASGLNPAVGAAGPEAFRSAVAPVYLRRNAEDVLAELPELVQAEEWEEFGPVDGAAYRRAVQQGEFMRMRRAAFAVERPVDSAKVERLRELAEEACENGRKVLVFSYFLDVVDLVMSALGDLAIGPLTGSVPADRRQRIIDEFTGSAQARVLVSQIQVGGVGVNLQAASVVVLCEPQLKPTAESQAIARAHRMGQVESVQVHRLLVVDSVDEHLMRILDTKRRLFDAYARRSALAEEVDGAVDVSEAELARQIVDAERTRLFVDPGVTSVEDAPVEDLTDGSPA